MSTLLIPGADPGDIQGVRTPALMITVPFLKKEHIFNLRVFS